MLIKRVPARFATNAATLASRPNSCFSPQPLKLKSMAALRPCSVTTKVGPVSRTQRSSSGHSIKSTNGPTRERAKSSSFRRTSIDTGS